MATIKHSLRMFLIWFGSVCGERTTYLLNSLVNYVTVGRWMTAKGFYTSERVERREELYARLAEKIADKKVLYLEFGVAFGDSIKHWSKLLRNERAHLHGFDSFEGLPLKWHAFAPKGSYSTNGVIPQVDDPRVQFFKGLFEQTLPRYTFPDYEVLVINIDCDLYVSTAFVLDFLRERIRPGTYLYFDEILDRANEQRAFDEFMASTGAHFRLLGATKSFLQALFECIP
jgi:hypothetical protein